MVPSRNALLLALLAAGAWAPIEASAAAFTVTNCNDSGAGSLRDTVAAAANGATIDMSSLQCSRITLSSGAISTFNDDMILVGPGADALAIDGVGSYRVLVHAGHGAFGIVNLTITHGKYTANAKSALGGCVFSDGNVTLTNSTISHCVLKGYGVGAYGGGIFTFGNLALINSTISDNNVSASAYYAKGGGAYVYGSLLAFNATISNNSTAYSGYGGGVYTGGNVIVQQSTISGNRSDSGAGWFASFHHFTDTAKITNSTVSGNVASKFGGGILATLPLTMSNSTIAFNAASDNAGIDVRFDMQLALRSTIVADNIIAATGAPSDLSATLVTGSNNLVTSSAYPALPIDTVIGCPHLDRLADNGGFTQTHAIRHDSLALDHGSNPLNLSIEQRGAGFDREYGFGVDIGAYEREDIVDDRVMNAGFEPSCDR